MGVDNFFLEVHPDPDNAPSDGPNMLRLEDFAQIVHRLYHINKTVKGFQ
jgi:2-dehydro-3-deoxyphosphooctonate aldolase (KDO 8-P synthase)